MSILNKVAKISFYFFDWNKIISYMIDQSNSQKNRRNDYKYNVESNFGPTVSKTKHSTDWIKRVDPLASSIRSMALLSLDVIHSIIH